ncbi:MAG: L,D-transpeptidase family protein [Gaiellaceae bacterium]
MRRRGARALCAVIALLAVVAASAYAWDESRAEEIAPGVRVGSIDLGGLDADQARGLLRRELLQPLRRPAHVTYGERTFTLPAEELGVRADLDAILAEATAVSRDGGLPGRLWRYATGAEVEHSIEPRITHSEAAVERFVEEVARAVNRDPQDASIEPTTTSLNPVPGEPGVLLREKELRAEISAMLAQAGGGRTIRAEVEQVAPEVTLGELAAQYPTYITVDRDAFKLRFFRELKLAKTYTIAVGQLGYETDPGLYVMQSKQVNPTWTVPRSDWAGDLAGEVIPGGDPRNPLAARWMGFNGAEGIHGTTDLASLGSAASHGCIRMSIPDVIELYDRVGVGTPVYIE